MPDLDFEPSILDQSLEHLPESIRVDFAYLRHAGNARITAPAVRAIASPSADVGEHPEFCRGQACIVHRCRYPRRRLVSSLHGLDGPGVAASSGSTRNASVRRQMIAQMIGCGDRSPHGRPFRLHALRSAAASLRHKTCMASPCGGGSSSGETMRMHARTSLMVPAAMVTVGFGLIPLPLPA